IPSIIHYGTGALGELGSTARELSFTCVLLVTDASVVKLGIAGQAQALLEKAGIGVTLFDKVQPDPTLQNVEDGLAVLRAGNCDGIVAVRGGSAMHCDQALQSP